jgi:hypothetical protein
VSSRSTSFWTFNHSTVLSTAEQCRGSLITRAVLTLTGYRFGWGSTSGHIKDFCCKSFGIGDVRVGESGHSHSVAWDQDLCDPVVGENHFWATTVTRRSGWVGWSPKDANDTLINTSKSSKMEDKCINLCVGPQQTQTSKKNWIAYSWHQQTHVSYIKIQSYIATTCF